MSPPSSIDGTKMICDHSTVMRELGETTPIKMLKPAQAKARARKINTKLNQFTGRGALNKNDPVVVMIAATIDMCKAVVNAGMIRIEVDGIPFIL